jgi:hypothetical protein
MEQLTKAPSPFLPDTSIQYAWDSTSLGYLLQCPRLYYYQMIEGWQSKEENINLRFGIEYHQALGDYDISRAAGIPHDDAVFDVVKALLERTVDFNPDHKVKTKESLVRTVIWYLDQFRSDPAETVLKADGVPALEVSFRFELPWEPEATKEQPFLLCGHLDRVVNFSGELFVMDRKTTSMWLSDKYMDYWDLSYQMTLYTLAGKTVLNAPIRGVIMDVAQIKEDASVFQRKMTYRTQDQIGEFLYDLRYWFAIAEQFAVAGHWPMNTSSCDKFGGCRFREVCSKSPQVRKVFLNSQFEKGEQWNPLKPR